MKEVCLQSFFFDEKKKQKVVSRLALEILKGYVQAFFGEKKKQKKKQRGFK